MARHLHCSRKVRAHCSSSFFDFVGGVAPPVKLGEAVRHMSEASQVGAASRVTMQAGGLGRVVQQIVELNRILLAQM